MKGLEYLHYENMERKYLHFIHIIQECIGNIGILREWLSKALLNQDG